MVEVFLDTHPRVSIEFNKNHPTIALPLVAKQILVADVWCHGWPGAVVARRTTEEMLDLGAGHMPI
jgi:hypothetical protein